MSFRVNMGFSESAPRGQIVETLIIPNGTVQSGPYSQQHYFCAEPTKIPRWWSVILSSTGHEVRRDVHERYLEHDQPCDLTSSF
jgi:hypothetical protein